MAESFIVSWIHSLVNRHQTPMVNSEVSIIRLSFLGFCNLLSSGNFNFWSQIFVILRKQGTNFGTFFVKYIKICFQTFQSKLETYNHQEHPLISRFNVKSFFKSHSFPSLHKNLICMYEIQKLLLSVYHFVSSFSFNRKLLNIMLKCESFIDRTQQTFQRCSNVVFWLM